MRGTSFSRYRWLNKAALGFAVLVLLAIVGLSYRQWREYRRANAEAARSRKVVAACDSVLSSLTDAETGQRGYLLTGENRYLEPYNRAIQGLPNELATLRSLLGKSQSESHDFNLLNALVNAKLAELGDTVELRRTQGAAQALAIVQTDQGKRTMDAIRSLCVQIQRYENAAQDRASVEGGAATEVVLLATVAGSLVLLFLFAVGLEPFVNEGRGAKERSWILRYGAAVLGVFAAILLRRALTAVIGPTALQFSLFYPAVLFASWFGGFRAGVLSIALSSAAADYYFTEPIGAFLMPNRTDQVDLLIFIVVSFGVALLGHSQRRAVARALTAEGAERVERRRFETTLHGIGDAVIATDAEGRITLMNPVAQELTGWSLREAQDKPLGEVFRIVNEETRETVENPVDKVRRLNRIVDLANHTILISKSGQEIAIDDSGAPISNPAGALTGIVLVFRDVTEHRAAERAIARLAAIVEFSGDAIITKNPDGIVQTWNSGAERIFGYSADEIIGKPVTVLFPADRLDEEDDILRHLHQGQPSERLDTVRVAKDGMHIHVSVSISPIKDTEGRIIGASKIIQDITELVAAREALVREKKLLATTLASIGDAVIATDAGGRVTFANQVALSLTGWSEAEIVGQGLDEAFRIVNEHTRATVESPVARVLREGCIVGLANHTLLVRRDGTEVPIDDSAAPIRNENGTIQGTVLVFRDIAERRQGERQIAEQAAELERGAAEAQAHRERLSRIIDSAMDAIITVDGSQRIQVFNRTAEQVFRCSASEAIGQYLDRFIPERYRQKHHTHVEDFGRSHITSRSMSRPGTLWGRRLNGEEFPVEATISFVEIEGEKLFTVILRDISERKRTEEELRREREQRSLALTAGKMGAYEINLVNDTFWWSSETYSLFGVAPDGFTPSRELFTALVHPGDRDLLWQHYEGSIDHHEQVHHEFRIRKPDGNEGWISCQGRIEYDWAGKAVRHSGIFLDITARKESEQFLRKFEKLSAAARLSTAIAHEINNPLGAVVNLIYIAKGAPGVPAFVMEQLMLAEEELERVAHATRQALGFYRESSPPEKVDILTLVESVLKIYSRKLAAKKIKVEHGLSKCAPVTGVRGELRQAISNLILNAIDAVNDGGTIVVGAHAVEESQDGAVEIVIADDGPGIAPENTERIFEPFFTAKAGTGTGLGLWVAKEIIERHGGHITVCPRNNEENTHGAAFTIQLPCAPEVRKDIPSADPIPKRQAVQPSASRVKSEGNLS